MSECCQRLSTSPTLSIFGINAWTNSLALGRLHQHRLHHTQSLPVKLHCVDHIKYWLQLSIQFAFGRAPNTEDGIHGISWMCIAYHTHVNLMSTVYICCDSCTSYYLPPSTFKFDALPWCSPIQIVQSLYSKQDSLRCVSCMTYLISIFSIFVI